jgi:hypothetical protein
MFSLRLKLTMFSRDNSYAIWLKCQMFEGPSVTLDPDNGGRDSLQNVSKFNQQVWLLD